MLGLIVLVELSRSQKRTFESPKGTNFWRKPPYPEVHDNKWKCSFLGPRQFNQHDQTQQQKKHISFLNQKKPDRFVRNYISCLYFFSAKAKKNSPLPFTSDFQRNKTQSEKNNKFKPALTKIQTLTLCCILRNSSLPPISQRISARVSYS